MSEIPMNDKELLEYYEKYKKYQSGVINHTLNLEDLVRLVYLIMETDNGAYGKADR